MKPENLEAFAEAFAAHAGEVLGDDDLVPIARVDAAVDGRELTLGLCEELGALAPFGLGNPAVRLLVGGCEVAELASVLDDRHGESSARREMAQKYPTTEADFARISGVGEKKRSEFGRLFLDEIAGFLRTHPRQMFADDSFADTPSD